jgi:hypothetical protein
MPDLLAQHSPPSRAHLGAVLPQYPLQDGEAPADVLVFREKTHGLSVARKDAPAMTDCQPQPPFMVLCPEHIFAIADRAAVAYRERADVRRPEGGAVALLKATPGEKVLTKILRRLPAGALYELDALADMPSLVADDPAPGEFTKLVLRAKKLGDGDLLDFLSRGAVHLDLLDGLRTMMARRADTPAWMLQTLLALQTICAEEAGASP